MRPELERGDALVVVDVQRDFCPGGALPVPGGDDVVPVLNRWLAAAGSAEAPVLISRDWHPRDHVSFETRGGAWPEHCVQDTPGAGFHPDLAVPELARCISKGVRFDKDQYSVFDDTGLEVELRFLGVQRLFLGGLALDVCVRASVLDGLRRGFEVCLIAEGCRAVDATAVERVLEELREVGARIGRSS